MACAPAAFAKDSLPFTILSTSLDAHVKLRSLPDFSFVERSGKKITLVDLRGNVWIANFIYTHCTDTCPLQTADMAALQDRWMNESGLKLVSFSVDPERDTPAILARYAKRFKADPRQWLFLTGGKEEIARLVEDGFRLVVATPPHGDHGIIVHSPRFVLVDQQGRIRGYYDNRDPKAMQRLKDDAANLLPQHPPLFRGIPARKF
jgi:cytochrome oxidase Cu insertion factor (SCO1/SenC/PrrC family)